MSDLFIVTCFGASSFIGVGLFCLLCKDFIWEIDLAIRKTQGASGERLKRDAGFDKTWDLIGLASIAFAVFLILYVMLI